MQATLFFSASFAASTPAMQDPPTDLHSPNKDLTVTIETPNSKLGSPTWSLHVSEGIEVASGSLGLVIRGEGDWLAGAKLTQVLRRTHREKVPIPYGKAAFAENVFNELRLTFKSPKGRSLDIVFRAFDDAVAFRYEVPKQAGMEWVEIIDENSTFQLSGNHTAYVQYLEHHKTSHEHNVDATQLQNILANRLIDLPATFIRADGLCMAITEATLRSYAGMSLMREGAGSTLVSKLTPRPDGLKVVRRLPMDSPWRTVLAGKGVGDLLESTTLFALNDPPKSRRIDWIRPGKMTWPWWNGHLFEAQPAEPILSFPTIQKYIDFCAENRIAFHSVVSDEQDRPWYVQKVDGLFPGPGTDVTKVREGLDLPAILAYAKSKGIRLWTWVHQGTLRGRVGEAFTAFEKMGWSGMMVDFFDHDDQDTVEFAEEILQAAAKHKILIHFHGIWKPTGWERTYPHLMNHEGVLNLEYLKWGDTCTPRHDLDIAITRAIAGPLDYHLGGFRSVRRPDFKAQHTAPFVIGTRCHQLALYLCFENPNPMVADFPAAYRGQPGFDFVREVPTWWDETRVLRAEIGKTIVVARRKGKDWWIGGLAAGPSQTVRVPLERLGGRTWNATLWSDLPEHPDPNRLQKSTAPLDSEKGLRIVFGEDGGFVAKLTPAK
jgi:alpha-glucosidase